MDERETIRRDLDARIAEVSDNIRLLVEQATAISGVAEEDANAERLEAQQTLYELLTKQPYDLDRKI